MKLSAASSQQSALSFQLKTERITELGLVGCG
jgi:hypothetical protein